MDKIGYEKILPFRKLPKRGGVVKFWFKKFDKYFKKIINFFFRNHKSNCRNFKEISHQNYTPSTYSKANRVFFNPNFISRWFTMRQSSRGYILILVVAFIPVILLGTKYCLDSRIVGPVKNMKIVKRCAKEAALEVAKKWNPGLTYEQQKWAMLKIADDVYNMYPAYNQDSSTSNTIYNAIPGLEMPTKVKVTKNGTYNPLKVEATEITSLSPSVKTIPYTSETSNSSRIYIRSTASCDEALRAIEAAYSSIYSMSSRSSYFVLEDTIKDCAVKRTNSYTNENLFYCTTRTLNKSALTSCNVYESSTITDTVEKRVNENDTTVSINVYNNKIKVTTDENVGYAVPAECNVDIVLGIPVNGAACNANNYDSHTTTTGSSYYQTVTDPQDSAKSTPIYQIAQAFRTFIKDNFYFTRGTNVGLIPYSGNLSIPSARLSSWAIKHSNFNSSYFMSSQNTYPAYFRSCYTYGIGNTATLSSGLYSNSSIYMGIGGCEYSGTNIMRRLGKFWQDTSGGYNYVYEGDLLSTSSPTTGDSSTYSYKFGFPSLRYVPYRNSLSYLNFCFEYYFDKTTSTSNFRTFLTVNPYHVAELQADLLKITDLLNCMYPVKYIGNSESNFIFLPVTWANNLFQTWTNDPSNTSTTSTTTLYRQPKTTSGRKKAVILVVNKPDWFEHEELTYLGFDDDLSEVPMLDGDCITFNIDYSDTTRKFADGSAYNGTIQGQKKILKFSGTNVSRNTISGWYECNGSGLATLSFPKKYLLKIVVESTTGWDYYPQALNSSGDVCSAWTNTVGYPFAMACKNGRFAIVSRSNPAYAAYSEDGITWTRGNSINLGSYSLTSMAANNGYFVAICNYGGGLAYSSDGISWTYTTLSGLHTGYTDDTISWDGEKFFLITDSSVLYTTTVADASSGWASSGSSPRITDYEQFRYGGGYYVRRGRASSTLRSSTSLNHSTYTSVTLPWSMAGALNYGDGHWVILSKDGDILLSSDASATSWSVADGVTSDSANLRSSTLYEISGRNNWSGICYGPHIQKWVAYSVSGNVAVSKNKDLKWEESSIRFPNISYNSDSCTTSDTYKIVKRKEFFIEADQITEGSDGSYQLSMDLKNIRLISAEITNRPYKKIVPSCYLTGTTSGTSSTEYAYIRTNLKKPVEFNLSQLNNRKGSVTFYSDNIGSSYDVRLDSTSGTAISLDTAKSLSGTQTFVFSGGTMPAEGTDLGASNSSRGANFAHNLCVKKVRYTMSDASITSCVLKKQILRDYYATYGWYKTVKALILNDNNLAKQSSDYSQSVYSPYGTFGIGSDGTTTVGSDIDIKLSKFRDSCIVSYSDYSYSSSSTGTATHNIKLPFSRIFYGVYPNFIVSFCVFDSVTCYYYTNGSYMNLGTKGGDHLWSPQCTGTTSSSYSSDDIVLKFEDGSCIYQYYVQNQNYKTLQSTTAITSDPITYTNLIRNKGIYLAKYNGENWICFQGDGELTVTVTPSVVSRSLYFLDNNGSWQQITSLDSVIRLSPDECKYEKSGDEYVISLKHMNLGISNAKMVDTSPTIIYTNPRAPEMSRAYYKIGENNYGTSYFGNPFSTMTNATTLIDGSCCYINGNMNRLNLYYSSDSAFNATYCYPGDFFILTDDYKYVLDQGKDYIYDCGKGAIFNYYGSGLCKGFRSFSNRGYRYSFDWHCYSLNSTTKPLPLVMFGATLPINATLFYGTSGSSSHTYAFQTDVGQTSWNSVDANHGVQRVTVEALKKLYSDWSSSIRIYVLLYRKQESYLHPMSNGTTSFDYSYITNLAANTTISETTAASSTKPIYRCIDVSDESGLQSTLTAIASEIKTWAGYTKAKNVD